MRDEAREELDVGLVAIEDAGVIGAGYAYCDLAEKRRRGELLGEHVIAGLIPLPRSDVRSARWGTVVGVETEDGPMTFAFGYPSQGAHLLEYTGNGLAPVTKALLTKGVGKTVHVSGVKPGEGLGDVRIVSIARNPDLIAWVRAQRKRDRGRAATV